MTPAERHLVLAVLERAAECWADGRVATAENWCSTAWAGITGDFVDIDEETNR